MKKRAVSPVIASILLIAIVVVTALIVFMWVRSFVKESITKFEGENIELACDKVEFETDYSGGVLYISNVGNVPLYSLSVKIEKESGHETKDIKNIAANWPELGLNTGGVFSETISFTDAKQVTLFPVLMGVNQDGENSAFVCDKESSGKEITI